MPDGRIGIRLEPEIVAAQWNAAMAELTARVNTQMATLTGVGTGVGGAGSVGLGAFAGNVIAGRYAGRGGGASGGGIPGGGGALPSLPSSGSATTAAAVAGSAGVPGVVYPFPTSGSATTAAAVAGSADVPGVVYPFPTSGSADTSQSVRNTPSTTQHTSGDGRSNRRRLLRGAAMAVGGAAAITLAGPAGVAGVAGVFGLGRSRGQQGSVGGFGPSGSVELHGTNRRVSRTGFGHREKGYDWKNTIYRQSDLFDNARSSPVNYPLLARRLRAGTHRPQRWKDLTEAGFNDFGYGEDRGIGPSRTEQPYRRGYTRLYRGSQSGDAGDPFRQFWTQ